MDEAAQLKEEIKALKQKYKNKCAKLEAANKTIKTLELSNYTRRLDNHASYCRQSILEDFTQNLDMFIYKVTFKYKEKIYTEQKILSFGSKWLTASLLIYLAREKNLLVYFCELEIISAEKLW